MDKLKHMHIMKLIKRDSDSDGWTVISDELYPVLLKSISPILGFFRGYPILQ